MPETLLPEMETWERTRFTDDAAGPYVVILYNCDCHTFEEVNSQLMIATGCGPRRAAQIAMEAHMRGRAIAFSGTSEECERVAASLGSIGLQVETDRA